MLLLTTSATLMPWLGDCDSSPVRSLLRRSSTRQRPSQISLICLTVAGCVVCVDRRLQPGRPAIRTLRPASIDRLPPRPASRPSTVSQQRHLPSIHVNIRQSRRFPPPPPLSSSQSQPIPANPSHSSGSEPRNEKSKKKLPAANRQRALYHVKSHYKVNPSVS